MTDFFIEIEGDFDSGPIERDALVKTIALVQSKLDVCAVLRHRYGCELEETDERWKTRCFLPSTVESFDGSCSQQDAASERGEQPANLWVSEGDTTRVWRCFSCNRRGDVIDLLEAADDLKRTPGQVVGLSAIRAAAKLAGVSYVLDGRAPRDCDEASELVALGSTRRVVVKPPPSMSFKRARAINARALKSWHRSLQLGPGFGAREELKKRGVTKEQAKRYLLGYAPAEWRELVEQLPAHARDEAELLGLIGKSRQGDYYDRYRDRLIFPYCEPARDGRPEAVTGFAGRSLSDDPRAPKWFNSRNVAGVWRKGAALFGLAQAKALLARTKSKRAAVGEGAWETLAFDRIDVACPSLVCAPMSIDHAHLYADVLGVEELTIAVDGDAAGYKGGCESLISSLRYGFPVDALSFIDPGEGSDPGKLGETASGLAQLSDMWRKPLSVPDYLELRGEHATATQRRKLLAALPTKLAAHFADAWGVAFDASEVEDEDKTPASRFVEALKVAPKLAELLAEDEVKEALAEDKLALGMLRGESLRFGDETRAEELPREVRRAWLELRVGQLGRALKEHEGSDPFAVGGDHAGFQRWFARGEELRRLRNDTRDALKLACKVAAAS